MKYIKCDRCGQKEPLIRADAFLTVRTSRSHERQHEFELCPACSDKFYRVFMALGGKKNEPVSDHQA